jgi:hypothetical protein
MALPKTPKGSNVPLFSATNIQDIMAGTAAVEDLGVNPFPRHDVAISVACAAEGRSGSGPGSIHCHSAVRTFCTSKETIKSGVHWGLGM